MNKKTDYLKYEENAAVSHLRHMSKIQTFKMGLELSELALRMLFASFQDRYHSFSQKTALNKFRSFLRTI